jgi:hypothetical protein
LRLVFYDLQTSLREEFLEELGRSSHAEILFVHYESNRAMVFFENDDSSFVEGSFGLVQEDKGIFIIQMR